MRGFDSCTVVFFRSMPYKTRPATTENRSDEHTETLTWGPDTIRACPGSRSEEELQKRKMSELDQLRQEAEQLKNQIRSLVGVANEQLD
ncbi:hypothetical protein NFI96_027998 [Prochilodus magdalenae]|nr:hypothetical protein NFI96_027998 [Prochilodus magdalenae]